MVRAVERPVVLRPLLVSPSSPPLRLPRPVLRRSRICTPWRTRSFRIKGKRQRNVNKIWCKSFSTKLFDSAQFRLGKAGVFSQRRDKKLASGGIPQHGFDDTFLCSPCFNDCKQVFISLTQRQRGTCNVQKFRNRERGKTGLLTRDIIIDSADLGFRGTGIVDRNTSVIVGLTQQLVRKLQPSFRLISTKHDLQQAVVFLLQQLQEQFIQLRKQFFVKLFRKPQQLRFKLPFLRLDLPQFRFFLQRKPLVFKPFRKQGFKQQPVFETIRHK